ncbi:hypothetical protein ACFQI7_03285 [Paenibacillus allorhizosphaerae]|uniref:Uncharacterized protein n=1 Tax=Paenibacillus allorhizosphaerae TaxID=2849866 RepID=A0ABM8VBF1_9BACL|nr:hypothetical protein [Paenibacillus allorhizosphaerae]CAG7619431.1 hypothetical protein PAECIP111802_00617 [Paenibacillus allorhizosphaerae]
MDRKVLRRAIFLIVLLSLIIYIFKNSGYSIIDNKVIRNSYPSKDGEVIYEKDYENKKTVIWKTDTGYYVKLVEAKWGILYHVPNVAELQPMSPLIGKEGDIKRTWSASLNSNKMYDTIFAVESDNPEIKSIIVSNDNIERVISYDFDEIKENSTVFIELNLEDGFAASYNELNTKDAGGFIFRGVNEKGEIIILGR